MGNTSCFIDFFLQLFPIPQSHMEWFLYNFLYIFIESMHIAIDNSLEFFFLCFCTGISKIIRKEYFMNHKSIELVHQTNLVLCYINRSKLNKFHLHVFEIIQSGILDILGKYLLNHLLLKNITVNNILIEIGYDTSYHLAGKRKSSNLCMSLFYSHMK
ncbi:MAG: hypothetical protein ACD_78C00081G0001 [uncultured bacterium (gcode 4)]|uniref:Uncharacterized protein n=1 Tax=uncultured bacterium (gcode 4) TaxID=1234023 RepID=K1XZE2_9BACT|nr:MAG: hypothetical protein ACD_78C00081G0001 [uncultured bacterium (gcode 4)]